MQLSNLFKGDKRTAKANKNVFYSIGIKGLDSVVQLLLVPITLGYLNAYEYGIWLTLNSILLWINSFDIGLGNGLRNQLAIAVAKCDYSLARSLVSTAFCMITMLMLIILAIGSLAVLNVDWYSILGATPNVVPNLRWIVYVSFVLFCVNFMVKFVGNVYLAMQMPAINNLLVTLGHLTSLVVIYILTKTTDGSLFNVAFAFSLSPVLIYIIAYPVTFFKVYKQLRPSIRLLKRAYLKDLFNVGILFFLLQISGVLLFAMSNVVISKLFGPDQVTPYNISHRYFALVNMLLAILIAPMWSAVTDAYAKGDREWIKKSLAKTEKLLVALGGLLVFMVVVSSVVYRLWVGSDVEIPYKMSVLTAVYIFVSINSTAYSYFLNGLSKLYVQVINTVTVAILFLPLSYLLGRFMGVYGVVLAMIMLNSTGAFLNRLQVHKVVCGTATGIWNK